ncbi:MAG: tetratricopeptide repeat protein, partial [Acidobacteriota bacterium]|nr:tetratricopeptide repeat protein [Acidobacteriota bacterium]
DTVMAQRHLAFSLHGLGEDEEAERLYLDAIERGLRLFGEDHPGTLSAMTNLGAMYEETGRPDKAEELYLETLEIQRRTAGEDHPATLIAQHNLGSLYLNQGRPAKAEEILRRTLEQRREILGELHDYTMQTKSNLALAYWDLGRDDEAEMLLTEVLDDRRRVLGREHVSTIEAASDLGVFYIRHNRHAEAVPLFERQIEILRRQEQSPKRDRDLYFFMVDLANIYKKFGRFEDAQAHYEEALEGLRAMEHRGVAVVSYNLACLAALRGDRRLAIDALRGAVEAGFKKPEHIQNDPDLVSLRLHPEFDEIIALAAAP